MDRRPNPDSYPPKLPAILVAAALSSAAVFFVANAAHAQDRAITVHNGGYAIVRHTLDLDLERGINELAVTDVAAHLEPDSVILRDLSGTRALRVLEQNYRADPISQPLLLSLYEGREIDFLVPDGEGGQRTVRGRVIRSGYVPHQQAWQRYGQQYYQRQMAFVSGGGSNQPIIEVDGQLRFSLPGQPVFPALEEDNILEPTLHWLIETDRRGRGLAELNYLTGGMSWSADYNLVLAAPTEDGVDPTQLDITGWVTVDNNSGRSFSDVRLKLMAGDINKIQQMNVGGSFYASAEMRMADAAAPTMTERSFDEYHLYTVERKTTLRDRETKQIEMLRAENVDSQQLLIYDGAAIDGNRYRGWDPVSIRNDRNYGSVSNPKVWIMREFENTRDNGLGVPLPKGRLRFYRQDKDGDLEFVGENVVDHTPRDETVRVYTGNSFDLVGERVQTDFRVDNSTDELDESFEITLRNRKDAAVEIRVVEHLYRWVNWEILEPTMPFEKTDARTIEFRVELEPGEETTLTYTAHYTW